MTTAAPVPASADGPRRHRLIGWALIAPALAAVAIIAAYPLVYTVLVSFSKSTLGRPFQSWVGRGQIVTAFTDSGQLASILRSLEFAVPAAVLSVVIGLVIALSLDTATRGGRVVRVIMLLPLMTPPVMAGVIWKLMFAPTGGLFNDLLAGAGLISEPVLFLGASPAAMICLIVVDIWQWTPFCVLLIFAALQSMPREVYEAAQVDGAGVWRTFRSVTFPLVLPSLVTVLMLKVIVSFKVFDLVFVMTSGGPGLDTNVASFNVYRTALQQFDLGAAGAQTIAFIVLVTIVVLPIATWRSRLLKAGSRA
jgi:multiple sugar transport system permease protein